MGSFKSDWHRKDMHQSRVTFVADVVLTSDSMMVPT